MTKIACWSGPRNLSTAMMYSFAQRMEIIDEPFYAAYLNSTGLVHPMRAEILDAQPYDPSHVAQNFPTGSHYLKLMTHHMLPDFPLDWASGYTHVYLIRHPARVVSSYLAKREAPDLNDIGYAQQAKLFDRFGGVVIDSHTIRANPKRALRALCDAIGLRFDPAMLSWPRGGHRSDGVWAAHWYDAIHRSKGFSGPDKPLPALDHPLIEAALPFYEQLSSHSISV